MLKPEQIFKTMRDEVYTNMLNRDARNSFIPTLKLIERRRKYKWFLRGLRSFQYLNIDRNRSKFLEGYYVLMRHLDDITDGDSKLPVHYESSAEFLEDKIEYSRDHGRPKDPVDYLITYCYKLGEKFGADFKEETEDILSSLLFDARRRGKFELYKKDKLEDHFHLLDIRGTVKATLKVFGEDPDEYKKLMPLGNATRIYYNLRDYDEDVNIGYINVPKEDIIKFDMTVKSLFDRNSVQCKEWFRNEARRGMGLLKEHNAIKNDFGILARATLPILYKIPSRRFFREILY